MAAVVQIGYITQVLVGLVIHVRMHTHLPHDVTLTYIYIIIVRTCTCVYTEH